MRCIKISKCFPRSHLLAANQGLVSRLSDPHFEALPAAPFGFFHPSHIYHGYGLKHNLFFKLPSAIKTKQSVNTPQLFAQVNDMHK